MQSASAQLFATFLHFYVAIILEILNTVQNMTLLIRLMLIEHNSDNI